MWKLIKRICSVLLVLATVALVLNLNVAGRPARDHAMDLWHRDEVQKAYGVLRDRVWALIRKDISVEDVFKAELPVKEGKKRAEAASSSSEASAPAVEANTQVIDIENLSEKDRQDLERILNHSSQKKSGRAP